MIVNKDAGKGLIMKFSEMCIPLISTSSNRSSHRKGLKFDDIPPNSTGFLSRLWPRTFPPFHINLPQGAG